MWVHAFIGFAGLFVVARGPTQQAPCVPRGSDGPDPVLFAPGRVSTVDRETGVLFSQDGRTIWLTKWSPDFRHTAIVEMRCEGGSWGRPTLPSFSRRARERHPTLSHDGRTMVFVSTRPVHGEPDRPRLWRVERAEGDAPGAWSEPAQVSLELPGAIAFASPSLTRSGTLYFAAAVLLEGAEPVALNVRADIWRALPDGRGGWTSPERVGGPTVSSPDYQENHVFVTPDESLLLFTSLDRPGGLGGEDLYVAHRMGEEWGPARHLSAPVNSPDHDYLASVSPDGGELYFTSTRAGPEGSPGDFADYDAFEAYLRGPGFGQADIYHVPLAVALGEGGGR